MYFLVMFRFIPVSSKLEVRAIRGHPAFDVTDPIAETRYARLAWSSFVVEMKLRVRMHLETMTFSYGKGIGHLNMNNTGPRTLPLGHHTNLFDCSPTKLTVCIRSLLVFVFVRSLMKDLIQLSTGPPRPNVFSSRSINIAWSTVSKATARSGTLAA